MSRIDGDTKRGEIEVRYDEDERLNIDEICAANCFVHIERMDEGEWAVMIYAKKEHGIFFIGSKTGRASVPARQFCKDPMKRAATKPRKRSER